MRDLLEERFPPQQNGTNPIVFHVSSGKLTDKATKDAVTDAVKAMSQAPHVHSVTNPLSSSGETAGLLSDDKRYAFAPVLMSIDSGDLDREASQKVFDATKPASDAGIEVAAAASDALPLAPLGENADNRPKGQDSRTLMLASFIDETTGCVRSGSD